MQSCRNRPIDAVYQGNALYTILTGEHYVDTNFALTCSISLS